MPDTDIPLRFPYKDPFGFPYVALLFPPLRNKNLLLPPCKNGNFLACKILWLMPANNYHQRWHRLWRHLRWYISLYKSTSIKFCRPLPGGGLPGFQPGPPGGLPGFQPGPPGGLPGFQPGPPGGLPGPPGRIWDTNVPSNGSSSACISPSYRSSSYCSAS